MTPWNCIQCVFRSNYEFVSKSFWHCYTKQHFHRLDNYEWMKGKSSSLLFHLKIVLLWLKDRKNLFSIKFMWFFQFRCLSTMTLRNFIELHLSILLAVEEASNLYLEAREKVWISFIFIQRYLLPWNHSELF